MNIVSYRGPGMAGGVSAAFARVWDENAEHSTWWHMSGNALQLSCGLESQAKTVTQFLPAVLEGHYNYCSKFLWPVLHDLPLYATYQQADHDHYQQFNEVFSRVLMRSSMDLSDSDYFVQDYQLALTPYLLKRSSSTRSTIFFHVPWPKFVEEEHIKPLCQIARGLLSAEFIGFHLQEYAENFLNFVSKNLSGYYCDYDNNKIYPAESIGTTFIPSRSYGQEIMPLYPRYRRAAEIIVAPLGLDFDYWSSLANNAQAAIWQPSLMRKPFVLSVDRADYTKGVTQRIKAMDIFFEKYPQWIGEVTFAQICGRTRNNIESFDNYWNECRVLQTQLQEKWSTKNWKPSLWLQTPFSQPQLSMLYRNAAAMLVNPLRDGLNLTAKEYIACQGKKSGVLALSHGAGSWQELGDYALEVNPENPEQIADTIFHALNMTPSEKTIRMEYLTEAVKGNSLQNWWQRFSTLLERTARRSTLTEQLREIS
jgi:trehalose 6-phosphate synthase/phosphatase